MPDLRPLRWSRRATAFWPQVFWSMAQWKRLLRLLPTKCRFLDQSFNPRRRSALPMTDTDEKLIAAAAIIGLKSNPKTG